MLHSFRAFLSPAIGAAVLLLSSFALSSETPGARFLSSQEGAEQALSAIDEGIATREVVFHSGDVELSGSLVGPEEPGPHPGLVFLHGSGPADRAGALPYARLFARLGITCLVFDKRGCGASGGQWTQASLADLADDALAGIELLREEDTVDPDRIGLWGVSQAGWVATHAAGRSDHVAFMVLVSGGGASPVESERFSYGQAFERAGWSEVDRDAGLALVERYFDYLRTGAGRDELLAALEDTRDTPLAELGEHLGPIVPEPGNRENWSWVATWDPAPVAATIRCPMLLLFGDRDQSHPTELAIADWRAAHQVAGNEDASIVVFPGAGHGIRMREGYTGPGRAPFADGYHEVMLGWLWRVAVSPTPR